jgi:3-oxoacyl-(acyl-carrier-protein) synthase
LKKPIYISALASVSPLGNSLETAWESYKNKQQYFTQKQVGDASVLVAAIPQELKAEIKALQKENSAYKKLDNTVLYGMYAARKAVKQAGWKPSYNFGINIGSSRGATQFFEKYHQEFLNKGRVSVQASPSTTLGNVASWVAHDLHTQGPEISHSITCSTALHALLNGVAWLQSGMCDKFLVGGTEASLTPFTIAQMQALKIYTSYNDEYPCKALDFSKKKNSMLLGEAASVACLSTKSANSLAKIIGVGYATEPLTHGSSISTNADCFQRSMQMALQGIETSQVDVIVTHTPGTLKGDQAEFNAIEKVFADEKPALTTNKWKLGHTFGASGMLSVEMAVLMLVKQRFIPVPYLESKKAPPTKIKNVLVNAVGFGGNAVSVLLSK